MIRSRLRRPMSKSMTATFLPRLARPTAMLALVVVLPTPPLPDVTTMNSVKIVSPFFQNQLLAVEPGLRGPAAQVGGNVFEHTIVTGNRNELCLEIQAVDARTHVALRAGQGAPAQARVAVNRAVGDHFGAVADRRGEHEITSARVDLLAGPHGVGVAQGGL